MNDAEFLFNQTARERKRNGQGDRAKKRQGGRYVRLPSDHLTKKEKERMSGQVQTYKLNAPTSWGQFKYWPADIQVEYITGLENKYGVTTQDIADMMGLNRQTLARWRQEHNCSRPRGGAYKKDADAWAAFLAEDIADGQPVECEPDSEPHDAPAVETAGEIPQEIMALAELFAGLKKLGAKLTIEVTL